MKILIFDDQLYETRNKKFLLRLNVLENDGHELDYAIHVNELEEYLSLNEYQVLVLDIMANAVGLTRQFGKEPVADHCLGEEIISRIRCGIYHNNNKAKIIIRSSRADDPILIKQMNDLFVTDIFNTSHRDDINIINIIKSTK